MNKTPTQAIKFEKQIPFDEFEAPPHTATVWKS